jgi:subtilase family serine protease
MTGRSKSILFLFAAVAFVLTFNLASNAEARRALITQKIDESHLTTLRGNTRPEANVLNDRGPASADLQLNHMLLLLKRPAELEAELQQFIEDQHNPKSASFHRWLGAAEFGERYGLAQSDIAKITEWLEGNGFKVNVVYPNNLFIDFSGTASQVENAFHTQIRNYRVSGVDHIANASDPRIPSALASAIVGVVSLNDFRPHGMHERTQAEHIDPQSGSLNADYTTGNATWPYLVVPWDLEKIYNIAPLYPAGISGQGTKIVLIENTDLYNCNPTNSAGPTPGTPCSATSDWATFRKIFGLGKYTAGNAAQENPQPQTGPNNCADPGTNGDDDEAALDVQWSSAAAPSASIVNAACADTEVTFGGMIAFLNILSHPNADNVDVFSISYGEAETENGEAMNVAFSSMYQQAVTAGIGVFTSSGDEDAASAGVRNGITISGLTSSPYDVSVGGLDFADTYLGVNSTYWNATNNVFFGSAKSYIMEQPWNDSCAGTLLAHYLTGSYITYGSTGFCNTAGGAHFHNGTGGSGGPSNCATGTPAVNFVANGTCMGWAKPSYQSMYIGSMAGLVNDSVRDTPDVSLMAANGLWGHYYPFCLTDPSNGGIASCTAVPPIDWPGGGGTSFASPIMAGIQALVVQHKGSLQGNPNERYYALAATEYGPSGNAACDSTLGNGVGKSCIFYDVTLGDNDAYCLPNRSNGMLYNCYRPSGADGVLSTSNSAYQPAYPTGPQPPFTSNSRGWDFASGIGSVNAYNLVMGY